MARRTVIEFDDKSSDVNGGFYLNESPYPSESEEVETVYREFLTLNGDGVTTSMRVNGSVTVQDFIIEASQEEDIYIQSLSIFISADIVVAELLEFGNLPALTNGCLLFYSGQREGELFLSESIRSNFDLMKLGNFKPNFGLGEAFKVSNASNSNSEGYLSVINLSDYGFIDGILLKKASFDKLVFRVRDNLNVGVGSISVFNIVAHGRKIK